MAQPLHSLDQHFQLPHVRKLDAPRALEWLRLGWSDMRDNLLASLSYGVIFAIAGYLILAFASDRPYLFTAAVSGFVLIGPLAAAGLYEISRRHAKGESVSFGESLQGLRGHGDQLLFYGVFLAIVLLGWERLSAILFALFDHGGSVNTGSFFRDVFLSGNHLPFVFAYSVVGGLIAAVIFALSAVSVPMLMDRDCDIITAMMASARAVLTNLPAMLVWAAVIVALIGAGFATFMIGMVVVLPLLGHASWHAYKELIQ